MIKSNGLYGAVTWRITEKYRKRTETIQMDALRRSLRKSRKDKIKFEAIRDQMGIQGTISEDIQQKQLTLFADVNCRNYRSLPKQAMM